jgi:hypothetical protein
MRPDARAGCCWRRTRPRFDIDHLPLFRVVPGLRPLPRGFCAPRSTGARKRGSRHGGRFGARIVPCVRHEPGWQACASRPVTLAREPQVRHAGAWSVCGKAARCRHSRDETRETRRRKAPISIRSDLRPAHAVSSSGYRISGTARAGIQRRTYCNPPPGGPEPMRRYRSGDRRPAGPVAASGWPAAAGRRSPPEC